MLYTAALLVVHNPAMRYCYSIHYRIASRENSLAEKYEAAGIFGRVFTRSIQAKYIYHKYPKLS